MEDKSAHYEQEAALIGAILADDKQLEELQERVIVDAFSWKPYRDAWQAIKSLKERGLGVDAITLGDELERHAQLKAFAAHHNQGLKGRQAISLLRSDANPRMAQTYAAKVMDYSAKRAIMPVLERGAYWATNGRYAGDIKRDLQAELDAIQTFDGKAVKNTVSLADAVKKAEDRTERAANDEIVFLETGYKDFDDLLGGGAENGDFIIIAGRPGTGKSSMMTSMAINIGKRGKKIAFFTLEMGAEQIAMRMISQLSGISYGDQKRGTVKDWDIYDDAVKRLEEMNIHIIDLAAITPIQVKQALRSIGKVDVIFFDYIQLAQPDEKQGTREREVSYVSQALKQIAKDFDAPMFAGAQLSREIEKRTIKKPLLSDLRESGSLEQDSDIVTFLHKPNEDLNGYEWIVAKHRNGPLGSIDLVFIPNKTRFESGAKQNVQFN